MALANKKYTRIYSTSGTDSDRIQSEDLSSIETKFNSKDYLNDPVQFDKLAPLLWQIQKMQEELDELRRYVTSAELLQPDTIGDNLPTSDPRTAGQLWSNRGVVTVSS